MLSEFFIFIVSPSFKLSTLDNFSVIITPVLPNLYFSSFFTLDCKEINLSSSSVFSGTISCIFCVFSILVISTDWILTFITL